MSLQRLSRDFVGAFQQGDYTGAARLLPEIKLEYAKTGLLAPSNKFTKEDLMAARQLLEMGVLVRIHAGGESDEIQRLIAQVRPFYSPALALPRSDNETKLLALHLLLKLTANEIAEFHTELETLDEPESDRFLRYPVLLERWLMEGAYDKAWAAVTEPSQFPAPEFAILTQSLELRIRSEIAVCSENAYESLPLANARHLLYLKTDGELESFAAARGWTIRGGRLWLGQSDPGDAGEEERTEQDAEDMIGNMLGYAAQIETII